MSTLAVSAGEASGDLHAARVVEALRALAPDVRVWAVGGSRLRQAGAEIVFPAERLSGMGLWEAAGRVPALLRARAAVLRRFRTDPPDVFVPVDFGGFNLGLAGRARRLGIPVVYFIPPKVWAWGAHRVRRLRRGVTQALVILPFEQPYLRERGVRAVYVGSPVADHVGSRRWNPRPGTVGLLPGSRRGEVERIWPVLAEAAARLGRGRGLRFLVGLADGVDPAWLQPAARRFGLEVDFRRDALEVMERSQVVLVASGTATLECALVGAPMVVVYRLNPVTYAVGRRVVRVPFISLPNLIAGEDVVPELVQRPAGDVARAAERLLEPGPPRDRMLQGLDRVRDAVGRPGASERAARRILVYLEGGAP